MIELPECGSVAHCLKCGALASEFTAMIYHPTLLPPTGLEDGECTALLMTLPSEELGDISEHLCKRCRKCGFGWMEKVRQTGSLYDSEEETEE